MISTLKEARSMAAPGWPPNHLTPRCFNVTLKDDSTKNFNIEIHKRVVDGPDMEQKVTEKVCRTFGINSRDVQSVSFYENRLNRPFSHVADELVDGSALEQLTVIDDFS